MAIHANLTDVEGIHKPKGFDSAPSPGYAYKDSDGNYQWENGKPIVEDKLGLSVYLDTPTDIVFSSSGWKDSGFNFTYVTSEGFTTDGAEYSGAVYNHPENHLLLVSISASVASDTAMDTVKIGFGVNSTTTPATGTENGTYIKNTDQLYSLSATFVLEGINGNEYTMLFYTDLAATLTVQDCQITAIKMYQEN